MKRFFVILLITVLLLSLCGCDSIFARLQVLGGNNVRSFGEYKPLQSDGHTTYWSYYVGLGSSGYIEITGNQFTLAEESLDFEGLLEIQDEEKILARIYKCALYDSIECAEEFANFEEKIAAFLSEEEHCEGIILQKEEVNYGVVNCYHRSAGRSGNLLAHENFSKSYIITIENDEIRILKELTGMVVLALTQTHYIGYEDNKFYSVNLETGATVLICDDQWWDNGPYYYSYVTVYFANGLFMICGNDQRNADSVYHTLIVGTIDGENISTLIDHKKVG